VHEEEVGSVKHAFRVTSVAAMPFLLVALDLQVDDVISPKQLSILSMFCVFVDVVVERVVTLDFNVSTSVWSFVRFVCSSTTRLTRVVFFNISTIVSRSVMFVF